MSLFGSYGWEDLRHNPFCDVGLALDSLAYTGALMGILVSHEMGHYLVAKYHGFQLSMPYFIPLPFGFGTLGAVIRLKSPPSSRTALLEMGVAGPLAGAVTAFLLLGVGVVWSDEVLTPEKGNIYAIFNDPLVLKLLGILFQGAPLDRFAVLHPVAMAGWIGCLLTGLNLIPVGQTDGGHLLSALLPRRAILVSKVVLAVVLVSGVFWPGWAIWAVVLYAIGAWRSMWVPEVPPPTARARMGAALAALVFLLTFIPVPVVWVAVDSQGVQRTYVLPWNLPSEEEP